MNINSKNNDISLEKLPTTVEGREGFFDMSIDDSADLVSPRQTNIETLSDSDTSSDEHSSDINITDSSSTLPIPLRHIPSLRPDNNCLTSKTREEKAPKTRTEIIIDRIEKRAPRRVIRRILKCSIAYFISTLFSTIHPLANALGKSPFLICSGCLFSHPGRTMGAQFDATLTSALGAAIAIAYGLAGVSAATTYNANHPDSNAGSGINCIFLLIGIFGAQIIRQRFPKLHFFSLQFMVVQLFTLTLGVDYKEIPLGLSSQYGLTFLIGNFVSLFVNLIFWPETAVDSLGRALSQNLFDTRQMLDTITKQFFLDPQSETVPEQVVDELAEKMRQGMIKINSAYQEAKYEMSYAYSCSLELNPIRLALDRITKHLSILGGSLKTEQVLFKSAQDTLSDEEESDDYLEMKKKKNSKTQSFSSGNNNSENIDQQQSQQSSWLHPSEMVTRDLSLRKAALKAANSYVKDGTYTRPYDTDTSNQDSNSNSRPSTSRSPNSAPDNMETLISQHATMNEKSIRFEYPSVFLGKLPGPRSSRTISAVVSNTHESENEDLVITSDKRKSFPHSLKSMFSSSGLNEHHSGKEEEYSDSNQNTATSSRSFLNLARLSSPKQKPPNKLKKKIGSKERNLLIAYLEKLRDPLLLLAVECATVLDCVRVSLHDQLDLSYENSIEHKSFWKYLLHIFKIKQPKNKEKRPNNFICNCAQSMRLQIVQFDKCEKERMRALYKINRLSMHGESLDVSVREELFSIFFFIFSLREVAIELEHMAAEMGKLQIKAQEDIKASPNNKKRKRLYMPQITTQSWIKWLYSSSSQNVQDRGGYSFGYLQQNMPVDENQTQLEEEYRLVRLATNRNKDTNNEKILLKQKTRESNTNGSAMLKELEAGAEPVESILTEPPPPVIRFRFRIWTFFRYFQNYEFRFALKLSFAVGILTFPAWIPAYRLWFDTIRGQWAALTVIAVMSPTSGGTLSSGLWRLIGTLLGAFIAWAVLAIDATSGYLLSGFAFVLAVPLFYIHFSTSYTKVSIVTLISYMIISLSQYVTPVYGQGISRLVWLRATTLVIGLIVALILNWMVWPFIARKAVRETLATTTSDLGDYFSYIMGTFLYHDEGLFPTEDEFKEAEKMEQLLEKKLITCNELLELTDHEPRLKGPFPKEFYKEILVSTHNLLDRMVSLRICLRKMSPEVKITVRKMDKYLYRRDMVASILLHFYTLTASLKAKMPLPSFMPSSRVARKRLLHHRRVDDRPEKLLRYRNLTWFAMACTTEEIIEELEHLTDLVRFIVGESKFTLKARRLEKKGKRYKK